MRKAGGGVDDHRRLRGNRYPNPGCKRLQILAEFLQIFPSVFLYHFIIVEFNLPPSPKYRSSKNHNDVPGTRKTWRTFVVETIERPERRLIKTMNRNILKNMNQRPSEPDASTSVPAKKSGQRKTGSPSTSKTEVSESKAREKMDVQLSNEQVALRAYFIGERRRKLGFPGDETSDWVEAKREISEELKGLVKEPAARGRRPV